MRTILILLLLGFQPTAFALPPLLEAQPIAPPRLAPPCPAQPQITTSPIVLQDMGQTVLFNNNPRPVMIIQRNGPNWITETGQVIQPLNGGATK